MTKLLLLVCLIFSIYSCATAWDWEADPYKANDINQSITNERNEVVMCSQPSFSDFWCFHYTNIAELQINILRVKGITDSQSKAIKKIFAKIANQPKLNESVN